MTPEQNEKFKAWAIGYFALSNFALSNKQVICQHKFYLRNRCGKCDLPARLIIDLKNARVAWKAALENDL